MKIPTTLKHKPVFVIDDYDRIDKMLDDESNAKGLSMGLAQWNDRGRVDISAKVWRYTGEKWSRQSEELPLHRVIDMAIMICRVKEYMNDSYRFPKLYDEKNPQVDRIGLQGDAMTLKVDTDNEQIDTDIILFRDALSREDERLGERLHMLSNILWKMGYGNKR